MDSVKRCDDCLFFNKGKCHVHPDNYTPMDEGALACQAWELSPEALRFAMLISLEKAREKHPGFVPVPPFHWGNQLLYEARQYKWKVQDGKGELQEVLLSECYEFMSALAVGDFRHALEEAGDVMAVLYRALNGEGKEVRDE